MNDAGTEMVIMNLFRNMDSRRVRFDFLVQKEGVLDSTLKQMGAQVHIIPFENTKQYYKDLSAFFEHHTEYKIIHTHTHKEMYNVLKSAKDAGIPCRIAHSHNSRMDLPAPVRLLKRFDSVKIEKNATDFFACSGLAARWLFPNKYKEGKIVYNAIDLEKFLYNGDERQKLRQELGIEKNEKIICHVGRFAKQKNHDFLISVMKEISGKADNIRLLLVGTGPLSDAVKLQVRDLNLEDKVLFLGHRDDVFRVMWASDLFLFPSLHEGLGIVLIEAQASGLKCITSDKVPCEADLHLGLFKQMSLLQDKNKWADEALNSLADYERSVISAKAMNSCYNIKTIAQQIMNFYEGAEKR